jgi:hypothetical protein
VRDLIDPGARVIGSRTGWTRSEIVNQPLSRFIKDVKFFCSKGKSKS